MYWKYDFGPVPNWKPILALYKNKVKYRGPILRVMWPALGSDDLNLDQSGTSIQILPEPNAGHVTRFFFIKLQL